MITKARDVRHVRSEERASVLGRDDYDFQINDIDFIVPPTSISVHKEGLNYSIKSLRTKSSVKIASGNGIYHVQVNITIPPKELLSLHRLICQVKNNPFVYVENQFLKDSLEVDTQTDHGSQIDIYFTVMGLNINNHPASPGSFIVELDLRYFNSKPYIENLSFFNDIRYGNFSVAGHNAEPLKEKSTKVTNPKDSKIYVRYSNYLQEDYLDKYFNIGVETDRYLAEGTKALHRSYQRNRLIEQMYESSKNTIIRSRNFINLKLNPKLKKTIERLLKKRGSKNGSLKDLLQAEVEKESFAEAMKDYSYSGPYETPEGIFTMPEGGITSLNESLDHPYYDFIRSGSIERITEENIRDLETFNVVGNIKHEGDKKDCPFVFLPAKMKLISIKDDSLFFENKEHEIFQVEAFKGLTIIEELKQFKDQEIEAGIPVAIFDSDNLIRINISKSLFDMLPYGENIEAFIEERLENDKKKKEEFLILDRFLSENYQPYIDRKHVSNNIFESIVDLPFADYKDYELDTLLGKKRTQRDEGLEVTFDSNTVITGVNGSLKHITPSIPILGQETPTHQFLGSMEPSYQISFIGKGNPATLRMPDSFLNLEKARQDSQANAKAFNEVPDAANFAINSLITKLLGSYEANFTSGAFIKYGSGEIRYLAEKFNFSVNSMSTFTVEGQPNTYGLNIHFQETRSYKEEEIRPAYTNYAYGENLSKNFLREIFPGSDDEEETIPPIETFIEQPEKRGKPEPKKKVVVQKETNRKPKLKPKPIVSQNYEFMNWKTKHFTSDSWYSRPKRYDTNPDNVASLKKDGREVSVPLDEEMAKVKKIFIDGNYEGELWTEQKVGERYVKVGSTKVMSNHLINPDYLSYSLCRTLDIIIDHFEELYPKASVTSDLHGKADGKLKSTLRINSNIDFNRGRGNHKIGSAVDFNLRGINSTEAAIYIYLMQRLNYIPDFLNLGRSGVFLGIGFYGAQSHRAKTLYGGNNFLHIDLNAKPVTKYVVNTEGKQYVFHVGAKWQNNFRYWTSKGYYFDGKEGRPSIGSILGRMKTREQIDSNTYANQILGLLGYETMKTYRERLEAAHARLEGNQIKKTVGTKNLINFWNEKLKNHVAETENIDIEKLELDLPDECGANLTLVERHQRQIINLKDRDSTFRDWYPASMIKFVAAIYSVFSILENLHDGNVSHTYTDRLSFKFLTIEKRYQEITYETLLEQAIILSQNAAYSLLVAIAGRTYMLEKLEKDYPSIYISYPFGFNAYETRADGTKVWSGRYTKVKDRWRGYGDILVRWQTEDSVDIKNIPFVHGRNYQPVRGRSVVGNVVDFSKLMIDFVEEIHSELDLYSENDILQEGPDDKRLYTFLKQCLLEDKGDGTPENLQNKLKYSILDYSGFRDSEVFSIYHKPGKANFYATDCLYFKSRDEAQDSFAITLWGRKGDATYATREFMTSDKGGTCVSLTKLLGYCIKYSSKLREYLKEE